MITLTETKYGRKETPNESMMIVSDMSKFPYGIKNMYRTKLLVTKQEDMCDGDIIYIENEAGNFGYFDPELIEYLKEHDNIKLFLSTKDLDGDRLLLGVTENKRIAVASYVYAEAKNYIECWLMELEK